MKTTAKKILLGASLALLGSFAAKAQGLDGIIVEKYYLTDANDALNAFNQGAASPLNAGSVVYRVYVDMAPGYRFVQMFGNANHDWKISTTTNFFNDPNNGSAVGPQGTSLTNTKKNTVLIDSWLTTGGVCANKVGVLKTEDTDGSIGNTQGILANNPGGVYGVAINSVVAGAQDGLAVGTPVVPTALGLNSQEAIFDQTPGGSFLVTGGSIAALGGVVGTTTTNAVLIGQFTTDGTFGFEFNIQVQNIATSAVEIYVAKNPQVGETVFAGLTLAPPTVGITSPLNGANVITGSPVAITATAAASGSVTQVQFFVDGVSVGTDLSAPYTANYNATVGSHTITATVTDNTGSTANATPVIITAANNQAPTISVSAPASSVVGDLITFTATANDVDGTVASVSFSVDNVAIGSAASAPFTYTWTATFGSHNVRATATDNLGLSTISAPFAFNVVNNIPPTAAVTAPLNNSSFIAPQVVTITAAASDPDGTVTQVEAFVNNVSIGVVTGSGPYTWSYATSTLTSVDVIKVVSTDNSAATTTSSPVSINIANPNALPYEVGAVKQQCNQGNFCLPISAAITYSIDNVIGYDFVLNYDAAKVTPTGSITVNGGVITPSYVTVINAFSNGTMNISAYFNGTAPANAEFNGTGEVFCVGFTKNNMASVDTAVYTISSFDESYFTGVTAKPVSAGRYTTYRDTMFNASLNFWADNSALAYDVANPNTYLITNIYGSNAACVTNTMASPVQPNLNGDFVYNILNGSSISIQRDILPATNVQPVINAADVIIARNVLLNTTTVTPSVYQMIALDVNIDGIVSAGDLSQMNQRSVGSIPEFKQAWNYNASGVSNGQLSKDWIFVDSVRVQTDASYAISATFPNNDNVGYSKGKVPVTPFCLSVPQTSLGSCPTINDEVYRGILVGDANGNWSVLSSTLQLRPSSDKKVIVDLSKAIVNGKTVEVPVSFISSSPVQGLDFAMKFDEANMTFNTMVNYPSTTDALAYFNPNDKTLKFTATNVNLAAYSPEQPVASIRFETTNGVVTAEQFNSMVGYLNGEVVAMEVTNRTVGINPLSADNSVSVYPNPTSGIINVTSISNANVELTDVTGKTVLLQTSVNASQTQQINVSELVNGVYILKVYNNDFVTVKKVVLNK